ncbi:MAG TPA: hypothetical protein VFH68_15205 [Polyangia bacterium]|jgi:hypothetical protein|nr:hypothetical protein [Polyangia bacterium]
MASSPAIDDSPSPADVDPTPIPPTLRTWFRVHCALDVICAIPLLLFPGRALGLLGWTAVDPVASRLCGAALLGIGTASVMVHRHGLAGYRTLLALKVVWSLAAVFALLAGIGDGAPQAAWAFLAIFIVFAGVWISYAIRLRQMARAHELGDRDGIVGGDGDGADSDAADRDDTDGPP